MDGDIFGDTLVDDLLALTGAGSDFDTSDLMDILEPDYLENNILLDDVGTLNSLGDTTALDDLSNFSDVPMPSADVHASFDAAVSAHDEAEAASRQANRQNATPARTTPALNVPQQASEPAQPEPTQPEPTQEDDTPPDPLDQVTSGMLPAEDLEALARLAAGDDEFPADDSDDMGLGDTTDPFADSTTLGAADFASPNLGASNLDTANTGAMTSGRTSFGGDVPSSGKNLLEDTLDERNQPSMDELEELALLASGGADLSSVVMAAEDDDEDDDDGAQDRQPTAASTASTDRQPSAESTASTDRQPTAATPSTPPSTPPQTNVTANQTANQSTPAAPTSQRFSQLARSWSQGKPLATTPATSSATTPATSSATSSAAPSPEELAAQTAELARHYRPPNQLRRYFNAGIMLEAADRLKDVLDIPEIPLVVFLGRAAERCLEHLPDHNSVTVAHLAGSSFVPSFQVPRQESFRRVLMAKDRAESNSTEATTKAATENTTEAEAVGASQQQGVLVADISDLELDDLSVALTGTHLLLTRLQTDPISQELKGTLTLVGDVDLRSGANFLRDVKEALESPITLMV
jgi:hypothetical protein